MDTTVLRVETTMNRRKLGLRVRQFLTSLTEDPVPIATRPGHVLTEEEVH